MVTSLSTSSSITRSHVLQLVREAAQGRLSAHDFERRWPARAETSVFLAGVREDIEDGVYHFPGEVWSGRPAWDRWKESDMLGRLVIDEVLLTSALDDDFLHALRAEMLFHAGSMAECELRESVVERLNRVEG